MSKMLEVLDGFFAGVSGEWFPRVPFDPQCPSPCEFGAIDGRGRVQWRPILRDVPLRCVGLEAATGYVIPDPVHAFYGACYAAPVECKRGYDYLMLDCGAWNDLHFQAKEDRLTEYLTARRERGLTASLPVASSFADSHQVYSVQLGTGAVHVENQLGMTSDLVAGSLVEFVAGLHWSDTALAMQVE